MSIPRPVVVVLVVLVVAFMASVVLGATRGEGSIDPEGIEPPGWLVDLGVRGEVSPDDLTVESGCVVEGRRIRFDGACRLRIDEGGGARRLRLVPVTSQVDVRFVPADGGVEVDATVPGDDADEFTTTVRSEGGSLVLGCPGGGGCVVEVAEP